tara:strand:- start:1535 stop:2653 length:1119 start_codon:yes stop_codon:yes gene_type:complete
MLLLGTLGCANFKGNLPSFTFGGDANKERLLGAGMNSDGLRLTVPVLSVNVPWPNIKATATRAVPAATLMLMDDMGNPVMLDENATMWSADPNLALYFHESQTNITDPLKRTPFTGPVELIQTNNGATAKILLAYIKDGTLSGPAHIWYDTGEPKMEIVYDAGKVTEFKQWEMNGTLIAEYPVPTLPENNKTEPPLVTELPLLSSLRLVQGKFHLENNATPFTGQAVKKYPNGDLEKQESFVGGVREGNTIWWHPNRKVWFQATYVQSYPEGTVRSFRPDGKPEYVYVIQGGLPSSMVTYDPDGNESGRVDGANPDGTLIYYHPNGNKKLEQTYSGGFFGTMTEKWFDEMGQPIVIPEDNGTSPPPVPPPAP